LAGIEARKPNEVPIMAKVDNHQSRIRCAIYTRKSSEEGLEQAFNSLHAQREACEAYIMNQRHEGWCVIAAPYGDGGFSGGTLERPALQSLLVDIDAGKVDVVVVYKIDRLTRSLFDFAKIVETFDAHKVSFVSVTQAFNTTNSMGRLTLNVLLSFAQFEREITGERIRDKVAASKKKGMWMGGNVPLGYDVEERKLIINTAEAETVRTIFDLYAEHAAVRKVKAEIDRRNLKTKARSSAAAKRTHAGLPFRIGHLYTILRNPLYIGQVHHKGQRFAGDHQAIIRQELWEVVQQQLAVNAVRRRSGASNKEPSLLAGLIYDGNGTRMTPSHAVKDGKRYRYYLSNNLIAGRDLVPGTGFRIPAHEVEGHLVRAICRFLGDTQRLTDELCAPGATPSTMSEIIRKARELGQVLATEADPNRYQALRDLVGSIQIAEDGVRIALNRQSVEQHLEIAVDEREASKEGSKGGISIVLNVPAELRRLGKEKRLIVAAHTEKTRPDPALIKAVVRAHQWFEMLKSRKVLSITDIARTENLPRTYVSSLIPLAFLAPDITEAILGGRQPIGLTPDRVLTLAPLPRDWAAQRHALGVNRR
jgi:site-specific DNA recombinase